MNVVFKAKSEDEQFTYDNNKRPISRERECSKYRTRVKKGLRAMENPNSLCPQILGTYDFVRCNLSRAYLVNETNEAISRRLTDAHCKQRESKTQ